jgi:hypothetical protein
MTTTQGTLLIKSSNMFRALNFAAKLPLFLISFFLMLQDVGHAETIRETLTGKRLVLDGAQCAGWQFKNASTVFRFDELLCSHDGQPTFQARIRWIGPDQFILIETTKEKKKPDCSPRVYLYKVVAVTTSKVDLKEIWLGWGEYKDSKESYTIKK